ncbi:hypothetical protein [Clavibacter phage 33]|nr:hypothetical protein [Clavibacter phage 33]
MGCRIVAPDAGFALRREGSALPCYRETGLGPSRCSSILPGGESEVKSLLRGHSIASSGACQHPSANPADGSAGPSFAPLGTAGPAASFP